MVPKAKDRQQTKQPPVEAIADAGIGYSTLSL
jgi:hypothetical protein